MSTTAAPTTGVTMVRTAAGRGIRQSEGVSHFMGDQCGIAAAVTGEQGDIDMDRGGSRIERAHEQRAPRDRRIIKHLEGHDSTVR
ncbi:hypothetical protein O6072_15680 [Mycolicibacterium neoaurum]|uniref:hypothetical protein n=1 Tax=Mycolicibacterium neoaurum TaxID=1795 RepID=UPI00248B2403|nr:hypothetical protein [Mycolicibacterium neoaurum]WBP92759.1 hypothetical protein O7W24_16360 [Mycolicibacterium neoaurum]WBS06321.1 hypothetical protein O6072_15680 [Mycolicibacterium neoaurum]